MAKPEDIIIYHANGNAFAVITARKGSDLHKIAQVAKILKEKYGWSKRKISFMLKPGERDYFHSSKAFDDILQGLKYADVVRIVKSYVYKNAREIMKDIEKI